MCSASRALGALDFLKTSRRTRRKVQSRATAGNISAWSTSRASRRPTGPDPHALEPLARQRTPDCPPDPFENAAEVSRRGDRLARPTLNGKPFDAGSYYGYATGIVGLRLFPNPDFDEHAAQALGCRALLHRPAATTRTRLWCGRTASACRAGSATSVRIRSSRRRIRTTRSGRTSARTSARSTSGSTASSTRRPTSTNFVVSAVSHLAAGLARHVVRSRPTTSTTRGR